jgi:hypothetical protein
MKDKIACKMLGHREEANIKIFLKEIRLHFAPGLISLVIKVLNFGVP